MNYEDLRDLFAGLALMGILNGRASFGFRCDTVSALAYETADAMIKAKYAEPEVEEGITAIKPKRKRSTNVSSTNS
jgi:hypothetical protein